MFVGLDLGTSSVKGILMTEGQQVIGSASAPLTVSRPHPGWSEQDPEDWWRASLAVLDALAAAHPAEICAVEGIGLSGQMHGATVLDGADRPLRPAILWNDTRSAAECVALETAFPDIRRITGNVVMPGFTAPKLIWLARHEPDVFRRVEKVLLPKDFIRLRLTGEHVSDMSDAAGTCWLDVGRRAWSDQALEHCGLSRRQMPRLVEGGEVSGTLLPSVAARYGMTRTVAIAGGGGDNAAAACGIGAVRPGDAFLSLGTSGVLFAPTARFAPNTEAGVHAFCHAVPNMWCQMGVILAATDSLRWLSDLFGIDAPQLTDALGDRLGGPGEAMFLPYLGGERTPHNQADLRGAFVGLGHATDRGALTRAVMEGVAFAFRDCLRVLADAGTEIPRAWAVGGGSQSRLWLKIIATVLDRPLDLPAGGELGAAFGAARLALCAVRQADTSSVCTPPPVAATIAPDREWTAAYDDAYGRYRRLYPALKEFAQS
ncbi:xylulokinase [Telmatospirillum siberiense]|uniref:Xylulose kinase n=2 Tax=Telmatospirillum siberiense TaxID=382514 RepID=A0A2N3PX90_9PROT|nr:xylulokinase [Telmatospirillum siberiense]PKU25026.1 xylulokinase [Telmatospirillum siberiense]